MPNSADHDVLPVGTRLPGLAEEQYEITQCLGISSYGVTYKARENIFDRVVAIKEYLPSDLAERQADGVTVAPKFCANSDDFKWGRERFLDEARRLSRTNSEPSNVCVVGLVEANGTAYRVMRYEEGVSLDLHIRRQGLLSEKQLKTLVVPILDSLNELHRKGCGHLDIQPVSIRIRRSGMPVLLSHACAKQALAVRIGYGARVLTPGYAAIEQYLNRGFLPGTDLYALGATMYYCITGVVPPDARSRVDALSNNQADTLELIDAKAVGYSQVFIDIVHWMLKPHLKDRPMLAAEILALLIEPQPQNESSSPARELSETTTRTSGYLGRLKKYFEKPPFGSNKRGNARKSFR